MATTGERAQQPGGPEITRVRYDGGILSVSWLASPNPATTYVINVFADGRPHPVAVVEAGRTMNGWLPVDLVPGHDYTVAVQEKTGESSHGWSQYVAVVLDTGAVTHADTDPATGALTLATPGTADETYRLRLALNGAPPGPETEVHGGSAAVPAPQPPGCLAAATLAVVVDSNDAVSIGPYGPAFAIPTERPSLLAADFDGTTLTAAWTPVTGATAYRVTVLKDGTKDAQADVAAPATTGAVRVARSSAAYTVVVQAVSSTGSGPASAPLTLVLGAPAVTTTTYDGATLTLDVTPPSGVTPAAYDVTVLRDDVTVVTTRAGSVAPLRIPLHQPVAEGASYTVSVRARVGPTSGPAATAPVVLVPADVTSVVCGSELVVTAARGALPAAAAIDAVLYTDGTPGTPRRVEDGTARFDVPAGAAAVAVRGTDGVATGPWSVPVPAPTAPPVFTAARAGGDDVALAWTGTEDATFRVALGDAVTTVHGTTASLPLVAGKASVTEVAGVAEGPTVSLDVVAAGPLLRSATTRAGRLVTIPWTPPAEPPLASVQPVVRWDGTEVALPATADNPVVLTLPEDVPNAATVALRGIAGVATGPLGNAATLLTVAPAGLTVTYDGESVVATWDATADAAVDRYAVTLRAPGADPVVVVTAERTARIPYAPETAPGTAPAVTVEAMAGEIARGVESAPVDVLVAPPVVTDATYDGTGLRLAWTGDASTYRVDVAGRGLDIEGHEAVLPIPPGPWTAAVRATAAHTTGAADCVPLITEQPALHPVAFDAHSGDARLRWDPLAGATGYAVTVTDGTHTVATHDVTDAECTLPASTFAAGGTYAVSVLATASTAERTVEGPPAATPLLATPPAPVTAAYDGATVRASWEPVAGASGYRVSTLAGTTVTALGDTAATSGQWPLTTSDLATGLVVQPLAGTAAGAPSTPAAVFPASLFVGSSYVAPQSGPALTPAPITLLLPQLFATAPAKVDGLPLGITLTATAGPYAWTLTIPATSPVWTFGASRADVPAAWVTLVTRLQSLGATPYGIAVLTEAVSRALPQTFAETLYFAYGLQFARGCFDLRPGVVLRVEYEGYQVAPGAQTTTLSGYVATAVAEYEVASYDRSGTWTNGLDAFLAALTQRGVTVPSVQSGAQQAGGGGALDAFATTMQLPFVRLVYPTKFLDTTSPGSAMPQLNAVLLAGATVAAVEAATDLVRKGLPPGAGVAKTYFRGRTVVSALVRVVVDGVPRLVPLGTTVGNVLAGLGRRPPAAAPLTGVTLRRPRAAAVTAEGPQEDWAVRLDWTPGDPSRLDLPLLHGDLLDTGGGS
ncbi:MAG TPA: hypothetical protein VNQ77_04055 [Frankiaceae bacterium]|nr:hypothetical protein [Frankiaceae bacterium]